MADYERDVGEREPLTGSGSSQFIDTADVHVRHGFVRKVFSILTVQLLFTFGCSVPFLNGQEEWKQLLMPNILLVQIVSFVPMIAICYMACFPEVARTFPTNYIILSIITAGITVSICVLAIMHDPKIFVGAAGITAAITFGLMLFAFQTTYDFTGMGPYLFVMFLVLFLCGIVQMFVQSPIFEMLYLGGGVLLFSMYIVFDVQRIIGGKHHSTRFSIDDYVFASLSLYLDIINLFIFILRIMGSRR